MAELKTKPGTMPVEAWMAALPEARRDDFRELSEMMTQATGEAPVVWGTKMLGFGRYRYTYASGRTGEWFVVGFAPRADGITLYLLSGLEAQADLLANLGRHRIGGSCLYVRRMADLDRGVLRQMLERAVAAKEPERVREDQD